MPRSIPACGGVYPRPRGGTRIPADTRLDGQGLSPPTRGNHADGGFFDGELRSIPAHAGEPLAYSVSVQSATVYPRPRGGTTRRLVRAMAVMGLSPPTRGNLVPVEYAEVGARSIPAHAGEPGANGALA